MLGLFKSAKTAQPQYDLLINGETRATKSYDLICSPFDLSPVGQMAVASMGDLNDAVAAAKDAFPGWAATSDEDRQAACGQIAKIFEDNLPDLSELITKEQGKPAAGGGGFNSQFEVGGCAAWAGATASLAIEDKVLVETPEVRAIQTSVPLGVVGSITPWNWPVLIAVWHMLPAIRAGNTVVIKPSPLTPLATARAVELMQQALPPGVVNLVTGGGEIGAAMAQHPDIAKIMFTGSTATGQKVMQAASATVKRLTLELGGNDAAIILPGAPVEHMLPGLFFGSFVNAGQTCGAIKRIYAPDNMYDSVVEALAGFAAQQKTGDGLDPDTMIGPLQNKAQWTKVKTMVADAIAAGARIATGHEQVGKGYALTPAIIADATQDMALVADEQFGPALPIVKYSTVEDAIAMANGTEYGLCASVWGADKDEIDAVAAKLEAGTVYENTHAELHPMVPFGGHKSSGLGVQFGQEGLASFTNTKVIYERLAPPGTAG